MLYILSLVSVLVSYILLFSYVYLYLFISSMLSYVYHVILLLTWIIVYFVKNIVTYYRRVKIEYYIPSSKSKQICVDLSRLVVLPKFTNT